VAEDYVTEPNVSAALQRATEALAKIDAFEFPAHSDREGDVIAEARASLEEIQRLLREQLPDADTGGNLTTTRSCSSS